MAKARIGRALRALANGNSSARFARSVVTVACDFCRCDFIMSLLSVHRYAVYALPYVTFEPTLKLKKLHPCQEVKSNSTVPLSLKGVENILPLVFSVTGEPVADYVVTDPARGGAIIRTDLPLHTDQRLSERSPRFFLPSKHFKYYIYFNIFRVFCQGVKRQFVRRTVPKSS